MRRLRRFGGCVGLAVGIVACASGGTMLDDQPVDAAADADADGDTAAEADGDADGGGDADGADDGSAACPPGRVSCGAECVDVTSDPRHCGGCGLACPSGLVCNEGACASACSGIRTLCEGACVDTGTNPDHCGSCGHACANGLNADATCIDGVCGLACRPGWRDLDGLAGCEYACTFVSADESCNGADDDCDGTVDEGFACAAGVTTACTTTCGSAGTGPCTLACVPPAGAACAPPAESCNGLDDDCDGAADDGFACALGTSETCTTGSGAPGRRNCVSGCTWGVCSATGEACNGVDDDGDGLCDEDFDCCRGATGVCTTSCGTTGTRACSSACGWSACAPPAESCNGLDDDCDGLRDEGFECVMGQSGTCTTGCGTTGSRTCSAACAWGPCAPPAETCNGRDDDCDTSCDDGFGCCMGSTRACTTGCGTTGTQTCLSGTCAWGPCAPPAETCNAADDDCDGQCDEGCRHPVHRSNNGTDHFYTPDAAEAACCGYTVEHYNYYYLYDARVGATTEFWRCWSSSETDHFYTTARACEGSPVYVEEFSIGFIGTSSFCGATPLYRLVGPGDHFYTTSAAERDAAAAGGWIYEGVAGYVWTD